MLEDKNKLNFVMCEKIAFFMNEYKNKLNLELFLFNKVS